MSRFGSKMSNEDVSTWPDLPSGGGPPPASTVVAETDFGIDPDIGTVTAYAKEDHVHGTPVNPVIAHVAGGNPHTQYCLGTDARLSDARTPLSHGHTIGDTTGLQTAIDGKAPTSHTHALSDITGDGALAALNTVNTAQVDDGAVTYTKMQDVSAISKLLGRGSAAGAGDPQEITLGTNLSMSGTTLNATGGGGGINTLRTTSNQTINAGAGVFTDITGLTFTVVSGTDYAFEFYITFQSASTGTGWRAGVNCPAGTLDFWAGSDVIANGAAGVATHTERHNTVRDDMTLLTATITQAVDLNVRIKGRYLCTANGTFAARFANELASNTQIVIQKGSWGLWW